MSANQDKGPLFMFPYYSFIFVQKKKKKRLSQFNSKVYDCEE